MVSDKSYRMQLLNQYIEALKTITRMPPNAPDFVAAMARKIVYCEQQLNKAGWEPVWKGCYWELEKYHGKPANH